MPRGMEKRWRSQEWYRLPAGSRRYWRNRILWVGYGYE